MCQKNTRQHQTQLFSHNLTGQKAINKCIHNEITPHLQVLQRPNRQGNFEKNTYTTEPGEIDQIMRDAWTKVYDGNTSDQQTLVDNFCTTYKEHIYISQPMSIQPIAWEDIKWACTHNTQTAG